MRSPRSPAPLFALALALAAPGLARAEEAPAGVEKAGVVDEVAETELVAGAPVPAWASRLSVSAFVDVYGAFNPNLPADNDNFFPGVGTAAKRANTFALNLAGLDLGFDAAPVSGRLQLIVGSAAAVVHGGEPVGLSIGPGVYGGIYEAYLSFAVPFVEGLVLDAGVFSSHMGFESFFTDDNWTYTRGWMAELSPYYQAGVKAAYTMPFAKELSAQLLVLNGWQLIVDNNLAKSLGAQVAWNSELFSVALNGWAGPELPGDNATWRFFGDTVVVLRPLESLSIAGSFDVGYEPRAEGAVTWWATGAHGRLLVLEWLALAGRAEHFQDPYGVVSGIPQALTEGTLTLEWMPADALSVKLEGRADYSTAKVFATRDVAVPSTTQALVLVGVVGRI